jgi:hypothetical protein
MQHMSRNTSAQVAVNCPESRNHLLVGPEAVVFGETLRASPVISPLVNRLTLAMMGNASADGTDHVYAGAPQPGRMQAPESAGEAM